MIFLCTALITKRKLGHNRMLRLQTEMLSRRQTSWLYWTMFWKCKSKWFTKKFGLYVYLTSLSSDSVLIPLIAQVFHCCFVLCTILKIWWIFKIRSLLLLSQFFIVLTYPVWYRYWLELIIIILLLNLFYLSWSYQLWVI